MRRSRHPGALRALRAHRRRVPGQRRRRERVDGPADLVPEGTRTIDIVDVSRLLLDETLMDAAFVDDDPRLGGHRPSRLPVGSALAMTTADGADVLALVNVRLTLTWIAGESPAGGKV